ncbi:MAG: hypothetical protein ACQEP5_01375 [Actinomycetota bacterium]
MEISLGQKILIISAIFFLLVILTSCDQSIIDIYTEINADYSGTRVVEVAVKTEYLQRGEVVLAGDETLYERIISSLPEGDIETNQDENFTYFKSAINFKDINFLQHISIDNFSEEPPRRFYAKMTIGDYFFYSDYFFYDYVDMLVDESLLATTEKDSDYNRLDALLAADPEMLSIAYQIKFPVKIVDSNADVVSNSNIALWNISYGQEKDIRIEGKRTKFLPYFLLVILGLIVLFILFLVFALAFSSRRGKRTKDTRKPIYSYDNYFKKDKYTDFDE